MEKQNKQTDSWVSLNIESDLKHLETVSNFIEKCMIDFSVKNPKAIFEVQLAVDEAITNIIEHAYSGKKTGEITVNCRMDNSKKEFTIKLKDKGKPFDPKNVLAPDTNAALDERKVGGLGIFFIKTLMQNIKYDFSEKGNELTLTKKIAEV